MPVAFGYPTGGPDALNDTVLKPILDFLGAMPTPVPAVIELSPTDVTTATAEAFMAPFGTPVNTA